MSHFEIKWNESNPECSAYIPTSCIFCHPLLIYDYTITRTIIFSQLAETVEDGPATSSQVQKIQSPILLKLVCQETI